MLLIFLLTQPMAADTEHQTEKKDHPGTAGHLGNKKLSELPIKDSKNKRSVWEIPTEPFSAAHFATFPKALIKPCILAGSKRGDIVLDPFSGTGTTGAVAAEYGRQYLGIELNPEYAEMRQTERMVQTFL